MDSSQGKTGGIIAIIIIILILVIGGIYFWNERYPSTTAGRTGTVSTTTPSKSDLQNELDASATSDTSADVSAVGNDLK